MRKTELDKYRLELLKLKQRLTGMVEGRVNDVLRAEDAPSVDHLADHGSDIFEQDLSLSLLENEQEAIQSIDEALRRIELGTYGECELCSEPISKKRLAALPHARLCLDCQEREDGLAG